MSDWANCLAVHQIGDQTGAMQQYYLLNDLDPKLAADLLALIPK
jgi:hypothetical protein